MLYSCPAPAANMNLVFSEEFDAPLSASRTGAGAEYAAAMPWEADGAEFGDAHFADPNGPLNPFEVVDDDYLKITASEAPDGFVDPKGWGRTHIGGLLSSLRTDATGFTATYGYFETRFMAPPGLGTWPAFWLMSKNRVTEGLSSSAAEIDIVEQHGESISLKRSSQASHCWRCNPETNKTNVINSFTYGDAARTWHTYGVNVTPTDTVYYLDGVETWRQPTLPDAHGEMFFMINLATGGGWPTDLSMYDGNVDMWVDYIRVYEPTP
ncbi:hypothetical protein NS183_08095 [Microbacterium testaceum]|nr:hypothetical protein NS183_08095 [Microbacterium testaceum]